MWRLILNWCVVFVAIMLLCVVAAVLPISLIQLCSKLWSLDPNEWHGTSWQTWSDPRRLDPDHAAPTLALFTRIRASGPCATIACRDQALGSCAISAGDMWELGSGSLCHLHPAWHACIRLCATLNTGCSTQGQGPQDSLQTSGMPRELEDKASVARSGLWTGGRTPLP